MAGNPGSLTGRRRGRRPAIILAGLAVALTSSAPASERTATVLLVEHPRELVVFNKYQQRLGPDDAGRIPPFVPIVVLRERDLLGDGFTPCASVEIDREPYFLLRDAAGGLTSHGNPGKSEILKNSANRASDKINILARNRMHVNIVQSDFAFGRLFFREEHFDKSGLAGARVAHKGDKLAGLDREAYILECNRVVGVYFRYTIVINH